MKISNISFISVFLILKWWDQLCFYISEVMKLLGISIIFSIFKSLKWRKYSVFQLFLGFYDPKVIKNIQYLRLFSNYYDIGIVKIFHYFNYFHVSWHWSDRNISSISIISMFLWLLSDIIIQYFNDFCVFMFIKWWKYPVFLLFWCFYSSEIAKISSISLIFKFLWPWNGKSIQPSTY